MSNSKEFRPAEVKQALLQTLPMALMLGFMIISMRPENESAAAPPIFWNIAVAVSFVFLVSIFFLLHFTGRIDFYRRIFFITMAVSFVFSFITDLIIVRGSIILTGDVFFNHDTPFCHLAIPMVVLPIALSRTLIFPGSIPSLIAMSLLWAGVTVAIGRGWCAWTCFYGGLDEAFSLAPYGKGKKKLRIPKQLLYLPFAILVAIVLLSLVYATPIYCDWLCPFKAVTEFEELRSPVQIVQLVLFSAIFIATVIILPILSRKRTQCALFCPLGAIGTLSNKINIFDIRIDTDTCTRCKACIRLCPVMAIDEQSLESGKVNGNCAKCGRCVEHCRQKAVSFHIRGLPVKSKTKLAGNIFIFAAYLSGAVLAAGFIANSIYYILTLAATGTLQ